MIHSEKELIIKYHSQSFTECF